jgi:hypothetical protein
LPVSGFAQQVNKTVVQGVVVDSKTAAVLPFADVYFKSINAGVYTDMNGAFRLETTEKVDSIEVVYLGYTKRTLALKYGQIQVLDISMTESDVFLGTATVVAQRRKSTKDTAAIALWRNISRARSNNSVAKCASYTYREYVQTGFDWYNPNKNIIGLKFLLKPLSVVDDYLQQSSSGIPFLPLMIKETISEIKYQKKPIQKKVAVLADQMSGMDNASLRDFIGNELDEMDFNEDIILITGKSFVSPLSAVANLSYNYFVTDSCLIEGQRYYELTFVGKRPQDFTFMGTALVHKATYGIRQLNFEISPHIALNFIKELEGEQQYQYKEPGVWVKLKEQMTAKVAFAFFEFGSRKNRARKNQIRIRKKMWRYDIDLKPVFAAHDLQVEDRSFAENTADKSAIDWDSIRPFPLDSMGRGIYEMIDSIRSTRFYKDMDALLYAITTAYIRVGKIEFGRHSEIISYNDIEGYRFKLGMRTTQKFSKELQFSCYAAYGLRDRAWKYGSKIKLLVPSTNRKWNLLTFSWLSDYRMLSSDNRAIPHDNIMNAFTRSLPMSRLMKIEEGQVSWQKDWFMGFYTKLAYQWRRFHSVEEGFVFSQNNGDIPLRHLTTSAFTFKVHWGHQERFLVDNSGFKRASMRSKYPIIDCTYTAGIKNLLQGDHNYHQIDFSLRHRLNWWLGYTKYQLMASKTFGEVPYPAMSIHLGNETLMGNNFAYGLMNEFEFVSDRYASIWISHHLDGLLLNNLPLISKLKLRSLVIFRALYGTVRSQNLALYDFPAGLSAPNFYAEIGFGIENIFKVLRVDFLWRLTQLDQPGVRSFGINISFAPQF